MKGESSTGSSLAVVATAAAGTLCAAADAAAMTLVTARRLARSARRFDSNTSEGIGQVNRPERARGSLWVHEYVGLPDSLQGCDEHRAKQRGDFPMQTRLCGLRFSCARALLATQTRGLPQRELTHPAYT